MEGSRLSGRLSRNQSVGLQGCSAIQTLRVTVRHNPTRRVGVTYGGGGCAPWMRASGLGPRSPKCAAVRRQSGFSCTSQCRLRGADPPLGLRSYEIQLRPWCVRLSGYRWRLPFAFFGDCARKCGGPCSVCCFPFSAECRRGRTDYRESAAPVPRWRLARRVGPVPTRPCERPCRVRCVWVTCSHLTNGGRVRGPGRTYWSANIY